MEKTAKDAICLVTRQTNLIFKNREPWQIVAITATSVLSTVWLWNLLNQDESVWARTKKRLFKWARIIPSVRNRIDSELAKTEENFKNEILKSTKGLDYILKLPYEGKKTTEILGQLDNYLALGSYNWKGGKVSGAVYNFDEEVIDLLTKVYSKTMLTNPLHADLFPGVCKMEAEVIRMTATLFNGDAEACGTMTTGGTESILMACKAYRDYAREIHGITKPNMVIATTAHSAFDKAAKYLNIFVKTVPVNPETTKVDIKKMEKAINKNTVMLVGSVPNFPYGTVDNIQAIAALGLKYNIPVHVDACLGGFVIVFMKRAGYQLQPFDFSVKGVTSISADPHKYGYTPKGSSVILYSNKKYRHHQFTVTTDWPGGVYGSPTVNGSRAGANIATCWATMIHYGEDGYTETTKRVIDTCRYIERGLRKIKGIFIYGTPATSVIALGSKEFDIYRLSDSLCKLGWNLNALQFPSGIHICVTLMHTRDGLADKFLDDVKENVAELMKNPTKPVEGKMAIYGVAQTLPDRSIVGEFTRRYLDSTYHTPVPSIKGN